MADTPNAAELEIWKPVVGFDLTHEVSSLGRVRSLRRPGVATTTILKPWFDARGYARVSPNCKTRKVHHLVLEAFVRVRAPGEECAHLDGNPSNNRLANLAWKTPIANSGDKFRHSTLSWGERHAAAKLSDNDVREIRRLRSSGQMWKDICCGYTHVSRSTVIEAGTGKTFRHLDGMGDPSDRAVSLRGKRRRGVVSSQCRP